MVRMCFFRIISCFFFSTYLSHSTVNVKENDCICSALEDWKYPPELFARLHCVKFSRDKAYYPYVRMEVLEQSHRNMPNLGHS